MIIDDYPRLLTIIDEGGIISAEPDVWANPESMIQNAQASREKPKTEGEAKDQVFMRSTWV